MNQRHLLSLLQEGYVTIAVRFMNNHGNDKAVILPAAGSELKVKAPVKTNEKTYTYKAKLGQVVVGDYVTVMAPGNVLKVCEVLEVHDEPELNLNAEYSYKWIVSLIDLQPYADTLQKERDFSKKVLRVERVHQRNIFIAKFKESFGLTSDSTDLVDSLIEDAKDTIC
jgi:hypothetical protein